MTPSDPKPRRKRRSWLVLVPLALLIGLGVAVAVPASPIYLAKWYELEPVVDDRGRSEWITDLSSPDKDARVKAATVLGKLNTAGRKALPELLRVMRTDPEGDERAVAADAVGKMYPALEPDAAKAEYAGAVLEAFTVGLTDPEKRARFNAVSGLLKKALARPAVPALLTAAKDPEKDTNLGLSHSTIRQMALLALGQAAAGTADGVPTFTAILNEKVERPKLPAAAQQMGGGAKVSKEDEEASKNYIQAAINRRFAVAGLGLAGEHGKAMASKIRELLTSSDKDDQATATEALERMGFKPDAK